MTENSTDQDRLTLISADCHASPPVAVYRDYVDPDRRDDFDAFLK